jgi:DNA polymerase V
MEPNSGSFHAGQKGRRRNLSNPQGATHSPTSPTLPRSLSPLPLAEAIVSCCYSASTRTRYRLNLYQQPVTAGFPSPAEDFVERKLDLNQYLIKRPAATFFVRVTGDSMIGAGDLLLVDRSIEPSEGKVVIAVLNGELTVKRLSQKGNRYYLKAENSNYSDIELEELDDMSIWGVVTSVVHLL